MPRVSVIIPAYNAGQFITQAIESVLSQTFKDFDIIVIDDGSTDNTREVLDKFESRIKSIYQQNQGISKTRNRGIEESQGELIAFLDADDYWLSEKLAQQVAIFDSHPKVGIVYGRMPIINEKGETIGLKPSGVSGRNFKELLEVWGDLPTSTVMVRRECFHKAGVFDASLMTMEDIDMWIRISKYYEIFEIENFTLAYYRRHSAQITKNKSKNYEGLVNVYTKILNNFPEAPYDLMIKRIAENEYLLAKEYYLEAQYKNAINHASKAILRYPLLGLLFVPKGESAFKALAKLVKPYIFWFICFTKRIFVRP